jgi:hypothetical protein
MHFKDRYTSSGLSHKPRSVCLLIYWPTRPLASGLVLIVGVKDEKLGEII